MQDAISTISIMISLLLLVWSDSSIYGAFPDHLHFLDKQTQQLANWISPLDFNEQQDTAYGKHTKDTGTWLLNSPEFKRWVDDKSRILWCPGKREFLVLDEYPDTRLTGSWPAGVGKTIIA